MCLRIILDNYFRLIFGHMTADALNVNESQKSCTLLTNKGIYLTEQFTNPCCCLHCLVKISVALLFQCQIIKAVFFTCTNRTSIVIFQKIVPDVNSANFWNVPLVVGAGCQGAGCQGAGIHMLYVQPSRIDHPEVKSQQYNLVRL